jgi:hypothetical protein
MPATPTAPAAPTSTGTPTATATATATPTGTATPSATATATSVPTATSTPSVTPEPLDATVPTDRRTEIETANRDLALTFPPGFSSAGSSLAVRVEPGSGGFRVDDGVTALRAFSVTAATLSGEPVTQFQAPITMCVTFSWASAQRIAQSALALYWIDPATGTLRTDGLSRVLLEEATPSQPGRLCFTTTHFTEFVVAASAAPPPTATPPGTQHRVLIPIASRGQALGG